MNRITILHLSDLHFSVSRKGDIEIVLEAMMKDLKFLDREKGIKVDTVLFSGDLVENGDVQDDFARAQNLLVDPLIKQLALTPEKFFVCPGNHDIQTSQIAEITELGLAVKLKDREQLNEFLDNLPKYQTCFERMNNFNKFRDDVCPGRVVTSNVLWSTYKLKEGKHSVGIACLNSVWRATGKPENHDYGKLLVGERQIDRAASDISDCDLRIAVLHHPFEWLNPDFELSDIKRRAFATFDLICLGHNHMPQPEMIDSPASHVVVSNVGCLYQHRKYNNSYTIMTYSFLSAELDILVRSYFDDRRKFDDALNALPRGQTKYVLDPSRKPNFDSDSFRAISVINEAIIARSNQRLLTRTLETIAPKDLRSIFVEPPISSKPEHEKKVKETAFQQVKSDETEEFTSIKDIINSDKNFMMMARKEYGKTSLLHYMALTAVETDRPERIRLPFYVNCEELPMGKNPVEKAIQNFAYNAGYTLNIDEQLRSGNALVLFDDLKSHQSKSWAKVKEFVTKHANNRFIFAVEDSLQSIVDMGSYPVVGVDCETLFIHPFRRSHARMLVKKWFDVSDEETEAILAKLLAHLSVMGVPRTPYFISLMLWIFEKHENYLPVNRSALVENLVETVLDKLDMPEAKASSLDYRNRQHYLSHMAYRMAKSDTYYFELPEFEQETLAYFQTKGLRASFSTLRQYFITKGVLVDIGGQISFKFKCFYEYFAAKRMIENREFLDEVLEEGKYLAFSGEIDMLTGLQRNNTELLSLVAGRLRSLCDNAGVTADVEELNNIQLPSDIMDDYDRERFLAELKCGVPSDAQRDEALDGVFPDANQDGTSIRRPVYDDYGSMYLDCLVLFSRIIKNCELIDDVDFKTANLKLAVHHWGRVILMFARLLQDFLEKEIATKVEGEKSALVYLAYVVVPVAFQYAMKTELGSPKLEEIIRRALKETPQASFEGFLLTFLLGDLKSDGYVRTIGKLIHEIKSNKYLAELVLLRMLLYYFLRKMSLKEYSTFENLIGDVYTLARGPKDALPRGQRKDQLIAKMRQRRLSFHPDDDI